MKGKDFENWLNKEYLKKALEIFESHLESYISFRGLKKALVNLEASSENEEEFFDWFRQEPKLRRRVLEIENIRNEMNLILKKYENASDDLERLSIEIEARDFVFLLLM